MKRIIAALALTTACGGRPAVTLLSQEATPVNPRFEVCELPLSDGTAEANCGTLVVPELRGDTGSATLRIPFQRTNIEGGKTPILYIGDGPGSSAYQFRPPQSLIGERGLLIVGARGVDGGRSLDCPEVGKALAEPSSTWATGVPAAFDHCLARFTKDGVRLVGYGIAERVADIEQARALVGYERVHLVADGFGAVVALTYARMHPEHVERIALLGPTPTSQPVGSNKDAARALDAYAAECARDAECAARGVNLAAMVRDTQLPDHWLVYKIDRDRVRVATSLQLAYRRGALATVGAWQDAAAGDASGVGQISWGANVVFTSSYIWGEVVPALASLDPNGVDMVDGAPLLPSATMVTAIGGLGLASTDLPEFPPLPENPVAQPTLVIHGDLDPRFSPETIVNAMKTELAQPSFTRVSAYGSPSELWAVAPDLLARTVLTFLDGGAAPSELAPTTWPPGIRLATMAKLVVTAMATCPLIAVVLLVILVRRLRRAMRPDAARPRGTR